MRLIALRETTTVLPVMTVASSARGPAPDTVLDQLALAPTVLHRLGAPIANTMKKPVFLLNWNSLSVTF